MMRRRFKTATAAILALGAGAMLASCKPSADNAADDNATESSAFTPSDAPMGNDFALTSTDVTFPDDSDQMYPDGPHADLMNQNCVACHSPSMVLTQPPLTRDKWQEEVDKMRNTFKAPVAEADVPAIVDYLVALSAKQGGAAPTADTATAAPAPAAAAATPGNSSAPAQH